MGAVALAGAVPASTRAATVGLEGDGATLRYTPDAGEADHPLFQLVDEAPGLEPDGDWDGTYEEGNYLAISDNHVPGIDVRTSSPQCRRIVWNQGSREDPTVYCPREGVREVIIELGDGDGASSTEGVTWASPPPWEPPAYLDPPGFTTYADGGPGWDHLYDSPGRTVLTDTGDGPMDRDTAVYFDPWRPTPLWLSLDGLANDGAPGEGDLIGAGIESLVGSIGDDVLIGDRADNLLDADRGHDRVQGAAGDDQLTVNTSWDESGGDFFSGDTGDDVIIAVTRIVTGEPSVIRCGPGLDVASHQTADRVASDCEVQYDAQASETSYGSDVADVALGGVVSLDPDRALATLPVHCEENEVGRCRGTLVLQLPALPGTGARAREGGVVTRVAKADFAIRQGRSEAVALRLAPRAQRLLEADHRGRLRAAARFENGAGGSGHARRRVRVRTA